MNGPGTGIQVEVFKTNVDDHSVAQDMITSLSAKFPGHKINFDLQDCDRILRVAGENPRPDTIVQYLNSCGYSCEALV
jgi:hypothetical protein